MAPVRRWLGARVRARSLRDTMVAVLTLAGIGGAVALTTMLAFVISPSFAELEQRATSGYQKRLEQRIKAIAVETQALARDQAEAASVAPRAENRRGDWVQAALRTPEIDGLAYRRAPKGDWVLRVDGKLTHEDAEPFRQALATVLRHVELNRLDQDTPLYFALEGDVVALGIAAVIGPNGRAVSHVAVARRITAVAMSNALDRVVRIEYRVSPIGDTVRRQTRLIDITVPFRGYDGRPVAAASIQVTRDVVLLGRRVLLLAVAGSIVLLAFLLLMLRLALTSLVLKPLDQVERHMRRVQASGTLQPFKDCERRDDEFGALGQSFNAMLSQLKDLREQNEIQSFALGRSESAVAVLHNVRNALAPLGTILSAGTVPATVADRHLVDRAMAELARSDTLPERREKLVTFVRTAMDADDVARAAVRQQIEVGRDAMRQTLEIIGAEQVRAHERPPRERCDITDIVAHNATIARYARSVSVRFTFPDRPVHVLANRVILSQVIGNLLSNAVEAIAATGRKNGAILVEVMPITGRRVVTRIIDDGEGFDPALATQLFQPGFSTRTDKSGGLGLHWCANSMAVMGGTLELHSGGRGTGAMATLILEADIGDDGIARLAA